MGFVVHSRPGIYYYEYTYILIYKTRSHRTLRLWGARLQQEKPDVLEIRFLYQSAEFKFLTTNKK